MNHSNSQNYYEVLGIQIDATKEDIKNIVSFRLNIIQIASLI